MMLSVMQRQHTATQLVADCITNRCSVCLSFNGQKRPVSLAAELDEVIGIAGLSVHSNGLPLKT